MSGLRERITAALDEDLGPGDLTTEATVDPTKIGSARVVAKEDVVVSGQRAARLVFDVIAARRGVFVSYQEQVADGDVATKGTVVANLHGSLAAILEGERTALNLLMRMTGIATHTQRVLQAVGPSTFRVVDTRKTTPLWRDLEKAAVRHGGAGNHRFGLFDGILIKDNHIAAAGGVGEAIRRARDAAHHLVRIEVEVATLVHLHEALDAGADCVMLDNMDDATIAAAVDVVRMRAPNVTIEASGNMDVPRMRDLAAFGIDLISVGGLIHHAVWADLSLKVVP